MILCKYYPLTDDLENCYSYINLMQKQLVAPITSELNDIFECMPFFDDKKLAKKFAKLFKVNINKIIKLDEYKKYKKQVFTYRNDFSIISMTKKSNNLCMWAHYANCHKGICIKYDISPDFLEQYKDRAAQVIKVKY